MDPAAAAAPGSPMGAVDCGPGLTTAPDLGQVLRGSDVLLSGSVPYGWAWLLRLDSNQQPSG